jgi:hypothetical protein
MSVGPRGIVTEVEQLANEQNKILQAIFNKDKKGAKVMKNDDLLSGGDSSDHEQKPALPSERSTRQNASSPLASGIEFVGKKL